MKKSIVVMLLLLVVVMLTVGSASAERAGSGKVDVETFVSQLDSLDVEVNRLYRAVISNKDSLTPEAQAALAGFPQQLKDFRLGIKALKDNVLSPAFTSTLSASERNKFVNVLSSHIAKLEKKLRDMREHINSLMKNSGHVA